MEINLQKANLSIHVKFILNFKISRFTHITFFPFFLKNLFHFEEYSTLRSEHINGGFVQTLELTDRESLSFTFALSESQQNKSYTETFSI